MWRVRASNTRTYGESGREAETGGGGQSAKRRGGKRPWSVKKEMEGSQGVLELESCRE